MSLKCESGGVINTPKLRFSEFDDEWETVKLGDVCQIQDGTHSTPKYVDDGVPFFSVETITSDAKPKFISIEEHEKLIKRCKPQKGDILLTRIGTLAHSKIIDWDYDFSIYVSLALLSSIKINNHYLNQYIKTMFYQRDFLKKSLLLAVPQKINLADLKQTIIKYPSEQEQEKIVSLLEVVDNKINNLQNQLILTQKFKKGLLQRMFSYSDKLRFPDFEDEWEEYPFKDLLIEVNEKSIYPNQYEVLSSTKDGIYMQKDYFSDRNVASKDNTGYKILRKNQVVLSPQNLWMGNINVNSDFEIGIVSPSYKIYDTTKLINIEYFKYVIKLPRLIWEYKNASEQGASVVRRNLNKKLFEDIKIKIPYIEEQEKIAEFLTKIDEKINHLENQLNLTQEFKKGLLQQMFI